MVNVGPGPGAIDYSDDPILPPWYISGWTSQNENNLTANQASFPFSTLPAGLSYVNIIANFNDADGSDIGGYLTFLQSDPLLFQQTSSGKYWRLPKRRVGTIPSPTNNALAFNWVGSGKCYLQFGQLNVNLLANDQPTGTFTVLEPTVETQEIGFVQPTTWVYHVAEYIGISSMRYDIVVPSSLASSGPVDIYTLMVPGTLAINDDWNRGI